MTCPVIRAPAHGNITCSHRNVEGSECHVTCDLGREVKGQDHFKCLHSRQWAIDLPECTGKTMNRIEYNNEMNFENKKHSKNADTSTSVILNM